MQGTIQFGHFTVNIQLMTLTASAILGYVVLRFRLKMTKLHNKVVSEAIVDSFIISLLVWKLSLIFFEPIEFINNPLTLMYFSGGTHGLLLALIAAAVYLIYSSRKQKVSIWIYADVIATVFLVGTAFYNLIAAVLLNQFQLFYGSQSLLALSLLVWQIKGFKQLGQPADLNQLLMWLSLGEIFISHFKAPESNFLIFIWGFSIKQLLLYGFAVLSIGINLIISRGTN